MQAKQQNNVHFRTSKNENCSQKHDPVEQCHVSFHRNKYIILLHLEVIPPQSQIIVMFHFKQPSLISHMEGLPTATFYFPFSGLASSSDVIDLYPTLLFLN